MFDLTNEIYHDAEKAREHLEAIHWPDGAICPHCGNCDPSRITKLEGKSTRPGVYKCNECRKPFSVTVGTVFERSKIGLHKWVLASHLMASSKKGMSAHQLHRMLGVTYKTAWFMAHRIREAMKEDVSTSGPLGGEGKTVEADETYIGKRETPRVSPRRKGPSLHQERQVWRRTEAYRCWSGRAWRQGPHVPFERRHQGHRSRSAGAQRRSCVHALHRRVPPLHRDWH
jgi:transposase-like protein